jgi:hypothetical protein
MWPLVFIIFSQGFQISKTLDIWLPEVGAKRRLNGTSKCTHKQTDKHENSQISPKQSWAYIIIFIYIQIFETNIFICQNICRFFQGRIHSDIHLLSFYLAKYIWIIILQISMVKVYIQIFMRQKKAIFVPHCKDVLEVWRKKGQWQRWL